ncbi:hypothetical protein ATANTOWER_004420, partial [Ataeniobius toweri]|nr:hypothetical protein [Ataeniobius toweri]
CRLAVNRCRICWEFSERLSASVKMLLCLLFFLPAHSSAQRSEPMFFAVTKTALRPDYENNPSQLNYGMAVTDVDGDGDLEIFVAGYNGPNLVLKYNKQRKGLVNIAIDDPSSPFYALRDRQGNAIGVTACDIDGDGREEIYVLNTNNAFSGRATYSDKLFKFRNGRFEDLLNDDINEHRDVANPMAGRSVACVDRKVLHTDLQSRVQYEVCSAHTSTPTAYMHGCFCLFTSDKSCPAYAALLSMCSDSSFGRMVRYFLSSVHRTSVITEAKARLFYRTHPTKRGRE